MPAFLSVCVFSDCPLGYKLYRTMCTLMCCEVTWDNAWAGKGLSKCGFPHLLNVLHLDESRNLWLVLIVTLL